VIAGPVRVPPSAGGEQPGPRCGMAGNHFPGWWVRLPQQTTPHPQVSLTYAPKAEDAPPRDPAPAAECRNEQPARYAARPSMTFSRPPGRASVRAATRKGTRISFLTARPEARPKGARRTSATRHLSEEGRRLTKATRQIRPVKAALGWRLFPRTVFLLAPPSVQQPMCATAVLSRHPHTCAALHRLTSSRVVPTVRVEGIDRPV
jgi:hypothetical protein